MKIYNIFNIDEKDMKNKIVQLNTEHNISVSKKNSVLHCIT